ncbi:c-type cytochrome biogenesis protein CcmI [Chloroflexota bacterium]
MTIFLSLLLTIAAFAFVAYPLLKKRPALASSAGDERQRELYSQRDITYSMLKELEFDRESGILTDDDYQDLEVKYKGKAISILKDIDDLKKVPGDDEIEKQVRKLRRSKTSQADDPIEQEVTKLRRAKTRQTDEASEPESLELRGGKSQFCSQCGEKHRENDRFCAHCGASLIQGEDNA